MPMKRTGQSRTLFAGSPGWKSRSLPASSRPRAPARSSTSGPVTNGDLVRRIKRNSRQVKNGVPKSVTSAGARRGGAFAPKAAMARGCARNSEGPSRPWSITRQIVGVGAPLRVLIFASRQHCSAGRNRIIEQFALLLSLTSRSPAATVREPGRKDC